MELFHVGTSGWSYAGWQGTFYPEKMKPKEYLQFYATKFNNTEINSSFYHLPKEQTVINWVEMVPDEFTFCPKLSRYITHMKKLNEADEPMERFFGKFDKINAKMGPVLVQLPSQVRFNREKAEAFYKLATERYGEYEFVIEIRHISWYEPESLSLMRKYGFGLVISQSGSVFPYSEEVTARNIYIRFHGPEELYSSSYTEKMLKEYAEKCFRWMDKGHVIWAFFNNTDVGGYAFKNAETFENLLRTGYGEISMELPEAPAEFI